MLTVVKWLCFAAFLFGIALPAHAQPALRQSKDYLGFLSEEDQNRLFTAGELTNIAGTVEDLPLWKAGPFREKVQAAVEGLQATIAAEGIFVYDNPEDPGGNLDLRIFRSFTSFSTLKGLQVFSVSKNQMETFLFDSSLVDSVEHRARLPDPVAASVPAQADYTVYEKEEQTGDSFARFRFEFDPAEDIFAVRVTNLTKMDYFIFTLVQPGDLHTFFLVVPCEDRLVLYGLTAVKTGHFFGLERVKEKSFFYRLKALVSWFASNLRK